MTKQKEVAVYLGKNINTKDPPHMEAEGNEVLVGGRIIDKEEGHWVSLAYEGNGKFVISPIEKETNVELKQGLTLEQIRRKVQRMKSPDLSQVKPGRTKKEPLTVTNFIDLKNTIKLKVTATPDNWKKLNQLLSENREEFARDFYHKFIDIALYKVILPKKPRGKQKDTFSLALNIKSDASCAYDFFSYWCKRPLEEWPDYLKRIIEIAEKEGHGDSIEVKDKYQPLVLTAYCIDKVYGKAIQGKLKPLFEYEVRDSLENFYLTYVQPYRRPPWGFPKMSPQRVAEWGLMLPPIRNILKAFKIFKDYI